MFLPEIPRGLSHTISQLSIAAKPQFGQSLRHTSVISNCFDGTAFKRLLRLSNVGSINMDCTGGEIDSMTNVFIQMSGMFAELELRIIRERVRSGMANARAKGAKIGRPQTTAGQVPATFFRHYPAFKAGRLNLSEVFGKKYVKKQGDIKPAALLFHMGISFK